MTLQKKNIPGLTLTLKPEIDAADKIATLLQRGFIQPVSGAISIVDLLNSLPGFSSGYIRDRVQTIFVNGLAEDTVERQLVAGDTLALSAAMPGLAGAIFRRGGQHASLRTRPVVPEKGQGDQSGQLTVKLFNMVATETGSRILTHGVLIRGRTLVRFFDRQGERILPLIVRAELDDVVLNPGKIVEFLSSYDLIFTKMVSRTAE